jgi:hypothetical protein
MRLWCLNLDSQWRGENGTACQAAAVAMRVWGLGEAR